MARGKKGGKGKKNSPKVKTPKIEQEPSGEKKPRTGSEPSSFHHLKAAWRVGDLEMCDPYGWHEVDLETFEHIRGRLSGFESMTWSQILVEGRKHHHSVFVSEIRKPARDRLVDIEKDDVDKLVSLSLSGKNRIWGILEKGVLRLLWWDPNHEICPSQKKHT